MSLNRQTKIDYLYHAWEPLNRQGCTLNICTGGGEDGMCHGCPWCYARHDVTQGRLKGHRAYPYGFKPTFHPERIRKYGGSPKLILLNNMGDVGGDWTWDSVNPVRIGRDKTLMRYGPGHIAKQMHYFAHLNPQHILLLLTKNPSWYQYADWPENVWCGFSATNNHELIQRACQLGTAGIDPARHWVSLEPWLDSDAPYAEGRGGDTGWLVIGGLSGPAERSVSQSTISWCLDKGFDGRRFVKSNAVHDGCRALSREQWDYLLPREYPEEWRIPNA